MRVFVMTLAGAIGGAALSLALILTLAAHGMIPINDRQMQTYMMTHPELALAMIGRQQQIDDARKQTQQNAALAKVSQEKFFDPGLAFVTGPANAKTTMVEFYDYDCPYCRASLPAVRKYYEAHKNDTRFAFIELPIESLHGPDAVLAAQVSMAARYQPDKFMALHFALMTSDKPVDANAIYDIARKLGLDMEKLRADMGRPEVAAAIKMAHALATKVGIDGTPTFIINGKMYPGMVDDGTLKQLVSS